MKKYDRIEQNPDVMFGKPVIRGTRVTVELILHKLAEDITTEQILEDHPHLKMEDIKAAQHFAADYIAEEEIIYSNV